MGRWLDCLKLNWRVGRLFLAGQWLSDADLAAGYDAVATTYDEAWLTHLRPVTDALLARLPEPPTGGLLDLGCGTGHATAALAARWPGRPLLGVDLSSAMLEQARAKGACAAAEFVCEDLLAALRRQPPGRAALIFSAWAIGYSRPSEVIAQAGRALAPGGVLAFVVNRLDTLGPVFRAFRECMTRHPGEVRRALWPRFPKGWPELERAIRRAGLRPLWHEEGRVEPKPPDGAAGLAWLLRTGVLAGFDAVLPLREGGEVAADFEARLKSAREPIAHHYVAAIARKEARR
jgi:SAM-dependent methyltransferase